MKVRYLILIAVAVMACGCAKRAKDYKPTRQELRMNMKTEPLSLDPRKTNDMTTVCFLAMCFDGLTRIGLDGTVQLSVAENIKASPDQKTYTVTLKQTFWSDGQAVKAEDFEKGWKDRLDPLFPCPSASDLFILKNARAAKMKKCSLDEVGVRALDERTLLIELAHPVPYFLWVLSGFSFYAVPSHIVSAYPEWADKQNSHYVTNGPFRLKQWRSSDSILLEKSENYWDSESVRLERVQLYIIEDEMTELSMFHNAELDWAGSPLSNLPFDALNSLSDVQEYPIAGVYYYIVNTKETLLSNVHLRQALALAIQRKEIIDNITQSGQLPATSFVPPILMPDKQSYFVDGDEKAARRYFQQALDELNLTLKEFPTLTLSYNTLSAHHKIAQAIQEEWRRVLGIKVQLANKEWKVYLDDQLHHNFQIARMGGIANNYDPMCMLDNFRYLSSPENFSQWTNPEYTELLEEADQTLDQQERLTLLLQAEKILMNEMPVLPIYFYSGSYLKKPYVKNVRLSALSDIDLKWAYVDIQ